jgi:hypothetical protein
VSMVAAGRGVPVPGRPSETAAAQAPGVDGVPKMRDILHSKPKIDEAEMALVESRTAARLAQLFGDGSDVTDEDPANANPSLDGVDEQVGAEAIEITASIPAEPGAWPGGPRPPIVVAGDADFVGVISYGGAGEMVGVMAQPGDDVGIDGWELPALAASEDAPDLRAVDDVVGVVEVAVDPTADSTLMTSVDASGGSDAADGVDDAVRAFLDPDALARVDLEPVVAAPGTAPIDPSRERTSRVKPARAGAGRSPATRFTRAKARSARIPQAFCPYCVVLLDPPPASSRRCARCRQRIVVKRVDGRVVYMTEAAVLIFAAERQRVVTSKRLTRERERWIRLAATAGAPAQKTARLTAAPISQESVTAARTLYDATVERAFTVARRNREWEKASRIRRDYAMALYRVAGSPTPPPADLVGLYREGVAAELRGISDMSRDAELVSALCCPVCRADDRRIFRIATELRSPRLPHEGCPKGLCRCAWDLAARDRSTIRRYLRSRPRPESRPAATEPATVSEPATTA